MVDNHSNLIIMRASLKGTEWIMRHGSDEDIANSADKVKLERVRG